MNECKQIQPDLSAYLDGELPAARQAEVVGHLGRCAVCSGQAEELRQLSRGVAAMPQVQPTPEFLRAVRRKIRAAEPAAAKPTWVDALFRPVWLKVPVEVVGVVAILAMVVMLNRERPDRSMLADKAKESTPRPVTVTLTAEPPEEQVAAAAPTLAPMATPAPAGLAEQKESTAEASRLVAADALKTDMDGAVKDVAGTLAARPAGPAVSKSETEKGQAYAWRSAEVARLPQETIKVESTQPARVLDDVTGLLAALQGQMVGADTTAAVRRLYVDLPSANVAEFKARLATMQNLERPAAVYANRSLGAAGAAPARERRKAPAAETSPTKRADESLLSRDGKQAGQEPSRVRLEIQVVPPAK